MGNDISYQEKCACAKSSFCTYVEGLENYSQEEKDYLLHGLALIGVRAVLGVENVKGSPFNVQRSLHIPNLTHDEVVYLFDCY